MCVKSFRFGAVSVVGVFPPLHGGRKESTGSVTLS